MERKKCELLNCIVGPAICKTCGKCDNPCMKEKANEPNENPRLKRLRKRAKAIRVLERQLKATCLYAGTGFAIRSISEQRENVPSGIGSKVVPDQTKRQGLTFDFGEIENELEQAI